MVAVFHSLRFAPTIRSIRAVLQSWGLDGSDDCDTMVYCGTSEFIVAAALARSTVGA